MNKQVLDIDAFVEAGMLGDSDILDSLSGEDGVEVDAFRLGLRMSGNEKTKIINYKLDLSKNRYPADFMSVQRISI